MTSGDGRYILCTMQFHCLRAIDNRPYDRMEYIGFSYGSYMSQKRSQ